MLAYMAYALVIIWLGYVVLLCQEERERLRKKQLRGFQEEEKLMNQAFKNVGLIQAREPVYIIDPASERWHGQASRVKATALRVIAVARAKGLWLTDAPIFIASVKLFRMNYGPIRFKTAGMVKSGLTAFAISSRDLKDNLSTVDDTITHEIAHLIQQAESGLLGHNARWQAIYRELNGA